MPPGPIRLFLIEHRNLLRSLFELALEQEPGFELAASADSIPSARALLTRIDRPIDVALIDLSLPTNAAIDFLPELHACCPRCRILVIEPADSPYRRALAVASGAAGAVTRHHAFPDIALTIRRAAAGEPLLSGDELHELLRNAARRRVEDDAARAKISRLTPRELDVLQALASGLSDKEIAADLRIKTKTVATHVANVLDKLEVSSRLQAALTAIRFDIVESRRL